METLSQAPATAGLRRRLLAAFFVFDVFALLAVGAFQLSKSRTFQFFGGLTARVETSEKIVALTFDDAPTPRTEDVLRVLGEKGVKGTFYAIGREMEKDPARTRDIVQAGHELGNHSDTHPRFLLKSSAFIRDEVEKTNARIRAAGYAGEITFRPPYGKKLIGLPLELRRQGMETVMWDVEPDTFHPGDADAMVAYVLETARPGSIILMHPFCEESCAADREALPRIIDGLRAKGFGFVTVGELLEKR